MILRNKDPKKCSLDIYEDTWRKSFTKKHHRTMFWGYDLIVRYINLSPHFNQAFEGNTYHKILINDSKRFMYYFLLDFFPYLDQNLNLSMRNIYIQTQKPTFYVAK